MATVLHKADSRGLVEIDWLKSRHTFSFGSYFDPDRMEFGKLRVLNDDLVRPSSGFDTHSHRDMEIISIPLSGALHHKDSAGNEHVVKAGDVQVMSAGTGITHSEYNDSADQAVRFLQIWIQPESLGLSPSYQQKSFKAGEYRGSWKTLASPDGSDGLKIHQDAYISRVGLQENDSVSYRLHNLNHRVYFFLIAGDVCVNDLPLKAGDGLGIFAESGIQIQSKSTADVLAIEVPV